MLAECWVRHKVEYFVVSFGGLEAGCGLAIGLLACRGWWGSGREGRVSTGERIDVEERKDLFGLKALWGLFVSAM